MYIIELPTNKGANSYKLNISKIGNYMYVKKHSSRNKVVTIICIT